VNLISKNEGLEQEVRKTIFNYILKNPGVHLNEISRKLCIPVSTVNYHLIYLKKIEALVTKTEGRYVRYYVAKKISSRETKIINLLRKDVPLRIVVFLLLYPDSSQIKISRYLGRHSTTIAFHLDKLIETDIVEYSPNGTQIHYRVKSQEDIFEILSRYRESLLQDTVDNIVNA